MRPLSPVNLRTIHDLHEQIAEEESHIQAPKMVAPLQGRGIFAITRIKVLLLALLIAWYVSSFLGLISQPQSNKSFSQFDETLLTLL